MKAFDKIIQQVKQNQPESELIYAFTEEKTEMQTNKRKKKERRELYNEIKNVKYGDVVEINKQAESMCFKFKENATEEYFMKQLYKLPLNGLFIEVKLTGKTTFGFIVHESKCRIFIITEANKIKQFDKKGKNFILHLKDAKYLIIGDNLKLTRLI